MNDLQIDLIELDKSIAKESFAEFSKMAWHVLEPGTELKWGWALDAICEHLEAVTHGDIKRLLMNVPPGCMKSLLTGVLWPAWEWGPAGLPSKRYLGTAHKQDLAVRDNLKARRLIQSEWYQKRWPLKLTGDQNAKTKFENSATGFRECMAFTSMTGSRGDRVLCFPYNQSILTNKGYLRIGDIVESKLNVKVLGANSSTLSWQEIDNYERNPGAEIIKITTERGSIECTLDHPVYVSGRGFVEAGRLRKGDRVKSLIHQDLRELREYICPEAKANKGSRDSSLLRSMPLGSEEKYSDNKQYKTMWKLWDACLPNSSARQKTQQHILFGGMPRPTEYRIKQPVVQGWESYKNLYSLSERIYNKTKRIGKKNYMQQDMRKQNGVGSIGEKIGINSLRVLQKRIQTLFTSHKTLFKGLQECGTLRKNAGQKKSKICTWGSQFSLSKWMDKEFKKDRTGAGRKQMPDVRSVPPGAGCTPHGLHQRKFKSGESDSTVSEMSWKNASTGFEKTRGIEDTVITNIERQGFAPVTYNLCVTDDHVYFPSGILAHNCDDPLSVDHANSAADLHAAEITFTESLPTRVNNNESAIIVIMQRLHERDTSGIILSRELNYTHLCLPMRFEAERRCATSIGFQDPRTIDGELLFPERFPESTVKELENTLGSYAAAGQLQQRPAPRDGGMFKRIWFPIVKNIPEGTRYIRGWDLAATEGAGDWTVGVKIGRMPSGRFVIADVQRARLSAAGVERLILDTARHDGYDCDISIPQDPGQAGKSQAAYIIQQLAGYMIRATTESGSKETRAGPLAAQAEAGNVDILDAAWNHLLIEEMCVFPNGTKDQVDAASRAFNELVLGNKFDISVMT